MTPPKPSTLVRPFTVAISDSEIEDLKQRLARTRWPNPETVPDWSQGVRLENAKSLINYWEREYDSRRFESELNRFPQFLTAIDGLDIHFIHVKSKNPNAMPLILTHGWPGSIVEFLKLIGPLTDPAAFGGNVEDSFHVVVPSLPGFGFSQKPTETGWTVSRIATAWVELMKRLGYTHWAAQGGDWGAVVTTALGAIRPEGLLGIHLNTQYAFPAQIPDTLSPDERYAVDTLALYTGELGGSNHLQRTKPETVGFALADSPAGQAAWIYEKFQSKTDNHGLAEDALSTDDMLDAISLYWYTNSAAPSGRIYWENKSGSLAGPKLTLPVAVTVFPRDIPRLPRSWIEDTYSNLIHYGEANKGGHFAAFEQPEILVSENSHRPQEPPLVTGGRSCLGNRRGTLEVAIADLDFGGFGPFVLELAEYEDAVAAIASAWDEASSTDPTPRRQADAGGWAFDGNEQQGWSVWLPFPDDGDHRRRHHDNAARDARTTSWPSSTIGWRSMSAAAPDDGALIIAPRASGAGDAARRVRSGTCLRLRTESR